jgi:uncharacterized glyoxalase superfamily protein PhnB
MALHDPEELVPVAPELFVPNVGDSATFYIKRLGFVLLRANPKADLGPQTEFAVVALGAAQLLIADETMYGPIDGARGLAIDIRLMVPDVNAMHTRCVENRVEIIRDIGNREYGLRDFIVRDPNGFRLRFASPLR